MNNILPVLISLLTVLLTGLSYYFYIRAKISDATTSAINIAEDSDKVKEQKMALAVSEIRRILPPGASLFISDKFIENIIQKAFDKIEEYVHKQLSK